MNQRRILPFQGWRLVFFQAVMVFSLVALVLRMGNLQFMRGDQFVEDAEENRLQLVLQAAPRGAIYDRNRVPLAKNDPAYNVMITPAELPEDPADVLEIYNRLSALIDVPATRAVADAAGRFNERSLDEMVTEGQGIAPYRAVLVAQDIERYVAFRILEQAQLLPGVEVEVASVREYPSGETTAHVIGYLGPIGPEEETRLRELGYNPAFDRIGYAGIEAFLEEQLAGTRGTQTWVVDVAGQPLQLVEEESFEAGMSVQLTLDLDLQIAAEEALTRRINIVNAEAQRVITQQGVVIAMDPRNGEILAMVSWPSYDNTRFARAIDGDYYFSQFEDLLRPLVNHAISALYPPGSVWKLITAVGALEEDVIDPNTNLYCAGRLVLPNAFAPRDVSQSQTFVCWLKNPGHQEVNLLKGIAQSCDIYFYQLGGGNPELSSSTLKPGGLGIYNLYRWATAFGIGSELGLELPGELAGRMPESQWKRRNYGESWSTGDTYNAAFGQGYVTVTPLQLLNALVAMANGGTLYQPTIIKNLQDANGNILEEFEPHVTRTLTTTGIDDIVLLLQEDMLIQGPNSLACRCEDTSDFYDEALCDPDNYVAQFDRDPNPEDDVHDWVEYRVNVPFNYNFNAGVCDQLEYESVQRESVNETGHEYFPPFADTETIELIQRGMREAVLSGTASVAALPNVNVAGKTGTAEYCDDIAYPLGLCVPGQWPAHAWYVGYAPYEDPEIMVLAFVYNGGEGSGVAAPVVRDVIETYLKLKTERQFTAQ
ncbi:MAG: penicillin-binding protein 2 [Anaerolineae bacterium]|nr:penicillin-binding protein 2 [Anaerolineae bacterium]